MARQPLLARRERHRRSTYCCCGKPPLLDWCWTHVRVGLYRFAFRRRLRAWPGEGVGGAPTAAQLDGELLSTPLAADFGPGPEASAEGRATGRGIRVPRLSSPTSGLARMGQRGARSWTRSLLFMPLAANFGPGRRLYGVS